MKREIYEAMKRRISIETVSEEYAEYLRLIEGDTVYRFTAGTINAGLKDYDTDWVDDIIHPMHTKNLWNVCQRFYSFIKFIPNINERLLSSCGM